MIPPDQRADEIAKVVSEARLATLQLEARAALELAKKTLAAVQGNSIDLETLEDIIMAQEYRLNIWPTPKNSLGGMLLWVRRGAEIKATRTTLRGTGREANPSARRV